MSEPTNNGRNPARTSCPTDRGPSHHLTGLTFLALVVLAFEMNPGWDWLGFGWDVRTYYVVAAAVGAVYGFSSDPLRAPGAAAGAAGAIGSLYLTASYLGWANKTHTLLLVIVIAVGCVPGLLLFGLWFGFADGVLGLKCYQSRPAPKPGKKVITADDPDEPDKPKPGKKVIYVDDSDE